MTQQARAPIFSRRWRRRLFYLLLPLLILATAALVLSVWALHTQSGARWLWHQVNDVVPALTVARVEGSLSGGLRVHRLHYQQQDLVAQVARLDVTVDVDWLPFPSVRIQPLHLTEVSIQLPPTQEDDGGKLSWPDLRAPVAVHLADVRIDNLRVRNTRQEALVNLPRITLTADYHERLTLHQLHIAGRWLAAGDPQPPQAQLQLSGDSELKPPYSHQFRLQSSVQLERWTGTKALTAELTSRGSLERLDLAFTVEDQDSWQGLNLAATIEQVTDQPRIQARLTAQQLHWPPATTPPTLALGEAVLTMQGRWPQLQIDSQWTQQQPAAAAGPWQLHLQQSAQGWQLEQLQADLAAAQLQAQGHISSDGNQAQLSLQVHTLEPAQFNPALAPIGRWHGKITASREGDRITIQPSTFEQTPDVSVDLKTAAEADTKPGQITLSGVYGQNNGQLQGRLRWNHLVWQDNQRDLRSNQGQLQLDGTLDAYQLMGELQLQSADLPSGSIHLDAHGDRRQLTLDQLAGQWLEGQLDVSGQLQWQPRISWELALNTENINPKGLAAGLSGQLNLSADSRGEITDQDIRAHINISHLSGQLQGKPLEGRGELHYEQGQLSSEGLLLQSGDAQLMLHSAPPEALQPMSPPSPDGIPPEHSTPDKPSSARSSSEAAAPGEAHPDEPTAPAASTLVAPQPPAQVLHWQLRLPVAQQIHPHLVGSARASGWVGHRDGYWQGQLHILSDTLGWANPHTPWLGRKLDVRGRWQLPDDLLSAQPPPWSLHLDANGEQLRGPRLPTLERMHLSVDAAADRQDIHLKLQQPEQQELAVHFQGDGLQFHPFSFQGRLRRLLLDHHTTGLWQLTRDGRLAIRIQSPNAEDATSSGAATPPDSPDAAAAIVQITLSGDDTHGNDARDDAPGGDGPLCLTLSTQPSQVCLRLDHHAGRQQFQLELQQLQLTQLNPWLPHVHIEQGELNGRVTFALNDGAIGDLQAALTTTPSLLRHTRPVVGGEAPLFAVDAVKLYLKQQADDRLHLDLMAALDGDGEIQADLHVNHWRQPSQSQLNGTLQLNWQQLSALRKLAPGIDRLNGRLAGQWHIEGPWQHPRLQGETTLTQATWADATTGLRLSQGDLRLSGDGSGELALRGEFQLGDGTARVSGRANPVQRDWQLNVQGESLQIMNGADGKLFASPDLQLSGDTQQLTINGHVLIPKAALRPVASDNPVTVSPDVVLAGTDDHAAADEMGFQLFGQLTVKLGDDVKMRADNARAEISGELQLNWQGDLIPITDGQLQLDDAGVRAYGQNLEVQRGLVVFENTPADNPRLDIRATRRIFGDPVVDYAGIYISGTAQSPNVRLYTEPATNEERALTYLVTGSNFDHGNGQGALSVGVYLFPRLFVSYGFGLFESGNVISTRYELSDHWSVQTVSGDRDTGVDITWSTDR